MAKQKRIIMQEALDKAFIDRAQVSLQGEDAYDDGYSDGFYDATLLLVKELGYHVAVSDTGKHSVH